MSASDIQERVDHELDAADFVQFDRSSFRKNVGQIIPQILTEIDQLLLLHRLFHIGFATLAGIEFITVVMFFTLLVKSSTLAIALGAFFLTLFSYAMLRLYMHSIKAEKILEIRNSFIEQTRSILGYQEGIAEHHMALANACCRMAATLQDREYRYLRPPKFAEFFTSSLENVSCWLHWRDLHKIKESFMLASVDEHLKLVKCEPCNLEVHAALANAYVMLSNIYSPPGKDFEYEPEKWIPKQRYSEEMQANYKACAQRAIEEFKILHSFAPNDPWVHAQLAYSYHDLSMPEEEIKEYQTILQLRPADKETLFKLGMLYFQQGRTAQGLKVYEELKKANYQKAENLLAFYGSG